MTKQQDPLLRFIAFTYASIFFAVALSGCPWFVAILADLLGF